MAQFLIRYLPPAVAYLLAGLVQVAIMLAVVMLLVAMFTWLERKVAGRMQDRLGPTRVGGRFGWLQAVADGLKLVAKEDIIPAAADRLLFRVAPYLSFCTAFSVFLAIPLADDWAPLRVNAAVFFILAVAGLEVFGVILGGYSSGSKWSLFGAMREAAQAVSYEVPLGLCVVVPALIAGSLDLSTIGDMQSGWFWNWLVFHDPFTFVTFWVYFTCAVASVNRAPFDLAEAESELVAGFMTEYSGFRWSVYFMAEYTSMLAVSLLAAILFFGGWNGPLPLAHWLGLTGDGLAGWIGHLLGAVNVLAKGVGGVVLMMWLRWTLPRLRIDQVMTMCLKYCIPLAAGMFVGATLWTYAFPGGLLVSAARPLAEVHEALPPAVPPSAEAQGDSGSPAAASRQRHFAGGTISIANLRLPTAGRRLSAGPQNNRVKAAPPAAAEGP
jgi:NADH-quinone oxidoreductase subunit H